MQRNIRTFTLGALAILGAMLSPHESSKTFAPRSFSPPKQNRYRPHQSKRECARRVSQMVRGIIHA